MKWGDHAGSDAAPTATATAAAAHRRRRRRRRHHLRPRTRGAAVGRGARALGARRRRREPAAAERARLGRGGLGRGLLLPRAAQPLDAQGCAVSAVVCASSAGPRLGATRRGGGSRVWMDGRLMDCGSTTDGGERRPRDVRGGALRSADVDARRRRLRFPTDPRAPPARAARAARRLVRRARARTYRRRRGARREGHADAAEAGRARRARARVPHAQGALPASRPSFGRKKPRGGRAHASHPKTVGEKSTTRIRRRTMARGGARRKIQFGRCSAMTKAGGRGSTARRLVARGRARLRTTLRGAASRTPPPRSARRSATVAEGLLVRTAQIVGSFVLINGLNNYFARIHSRSSSEPAATSQQLRRRKT